MNYKSREQNSNNKFIKLGRLIESYRRKRSYSVNKLLNNRSHRICNERTYRKLQSNEIVNENIYIELVKRLGFNSANYHSFNFEELWSDIEYHKYNEVQTIIDKFKVESNHFEKNNIFLNAFFYIISLIESYVIEKKKIRKRRNRLSI